MRIRSIYMKGVGPMRERTLDFRDSWRGGTHPLVLLSGPNGCGKSTILRGLAHLWQLLGHWLTTPVAAGKGVATSRRWLDQCDAFGVILDDVYGVRGPLGVFYGEEESFTRKHAEAEDVRWWVGEVVRHTGKPGKPPRQRIEENDLQKSELAEGYRRLVLGSQADGTPNLIYLDGEERKWVKPTYGTGEVVPDDAAMRWVVTYRPTSEWKGQLEASLIAMKTVSPNGYYQVIRDLNGFFAGKEILPEPDPHSLRLMVQIKDNGKHSLDDLSAGEHQVMIQLYLVSRFMQPGGVVLIDEPDLHLHPGLVAPFLSKLESLIESRKGQLILTSHMPSIWERYEARGHREKLGGEL